MTRYRRPERVQLISSPSMPVIATKDVFVLLDELHSEVGAVDFEALVVGEHGAGRGPAEVVHDVGEQDEFEIDVGGGRGVLGEFGGEEEGEVGRADGVVDGGGGGVGAEVGENGC